MIKFIKFLLFALCLFGVKTAAFAQFTGPNSTDKMYTVKEIKSSAAKLDRSEELVKVKGFIVKQVNKDTYKFKDSTGDILVEIKKRYLPAKPFDEKTELILIGEVDYDFLEGTEIEVEQVLFVEP